MKRKRKLYLHEGIFNVNLRDFIPEDSPESDDADMVVDKSVPGLNTERALESDPNPLRSELALSHWILFRDSLKDFPECIEGLRSDPDYPF